MIMNTDWSVFSFLYTEPQKCGAVLMTILVLSK